MIIKKFRGKTEEEAVSTAKKELGSNVVIMNVKNMKKRGILFFFKKPLVEVTAALEEEPSKAVPRPVRSDISVMPEPKEFDNTINFQGNRSDRLLEEKLESLHSLIEQQLVKEIEGNEEEFKEEDDKNIAFLKLIYNTLIENEIDEKYVNELMEEIEKINKPNATIDYILSSIYQKMILKFGQPKSIVPARKGAKILFFIGPTGVGKTTTIAKLASRLSVNEKKKVALLTADTYRIAAAEQLRTYASILDAPFRVIYSAEELTTAVKAFSSFDYILIDTAGHSHNNEMQKNGMNQLIKSVDESMEKEIYLVVSATTKYKDLVGITDAYLTLMDYKLIFTKLDETKTFGNLFNLRLHTGADLSYITCGQNVPDDIEQFSPQSTVKQLLGGK